MAILLAGEAVIAATINFDDVAVPTTSSFPSNHYVGEGAVFTVNFPVYNVCVAEPVCCSAFNSAGGSRSNAIYLTTCKDIRFVVPGTSVPAVIDSFSARFFDAEIGSTAGTIEAYDQYGQLLDSVTGTTPTTNAVLLQVSSPGIAKVRLCTDGDKAYVDDMWFTTPESRLLVSIRLSQVEICWPSLAESAYKVEYRSELTTNHWADLLPTNIVATGSETCVFDDVPRGSPQRYYRVVKVP